MITIYNLWDHSINGTFDEFIAIENDHECVINLEECGIRAYNRCKRSEITHIAFKNNTIVFTLNRDNQSRETPPFTIEELMSLIDKTINIYINNYDVETYLDKNDFVSIYLFDVKSVYIDIKHNCIYIYDETSDKEPCPLITYD